MSCDRLEPLIVLDPGEQTVTRHRRDCSSASAVLSSKEAANAGMRVMNQTEFLDSGVRGEQGLYLHVPQNHLCMSQRSLHLALAEGVVL